MDSLLLPPPRQPYVNVITTLAVWLDAPYRLVSETQDTLACLEESSTLSQVRLSDAEERCVCDRIGSPWRTVKHTVIDIRAGPSELAMNQGQERHFHFLNSRAVPSESGLRGVGGGALCL
jgi:hypothetical protein